MFTVWCKPLVFTEVKNLIASAERNIDAAENIVGIEHEVAHNTAYTGIQQLAKALTTFDGSKIKSRNYHKNMLRHIKYKYGHKISSDVITECDRARIRRNDSNYIKTGTISLSSARYTIKISKEFLYEIKEIIYN